MKLSIIIITLTALLSLSACSQSAPESECSPYFKAERIEIPDGYELLDTQLDVSDNRLEVRICTPYDAETRSQELFTLSIDTLTGEQSLEPIDELGGERTLYTGRIGSSRISVTGILGNMSYDSVTLTESDESGEILRTLELGELFETDLSKLRANMAGDGDIFTIHAVFEHENRLTVVSNIGVASVAEDGTKRLWLSDESIKSASYANGRLVIVTDKPLEFSLDSLTPGEPFSLPEGHDETSFFALEGYELATRTSEGVYGFSRNEDGKLVETLVCDFGSVDINSATLSRFTAASAEEFYLIERNSVTLANTLWRLSMIPADEYVEKIELTVAFYPTNNNDDIRQAIVDFNRKSDKYRFRVKLYVTEDEYINSTSLAPVKTRFAADISAGDVPDVVVLEQLLTQDVDDFEALGLFCDLYALMDSAGYDREQILACQRESFERENPRTGDTYLPYLSLVSSARTLLSDPAEFSGRLTLEGLLDLQDEGKKPLKFYSKWTPISEFLLRELDRFIDELGVPHFDSPLFMRMLEATKSDLTYDRETEGIFTEYAISQPSRIVKYFALNGIPLPNFAGYPDKNGTGVELAATKIIGITEACKHKDAAFELLEILLSDEYQCRKHSVSLPMLTESSFEWYMSEQLMRYYYISKNGRVSASSAKPFTDERLEQLRSELGEGVYITVGDDFVEFIRNAVLSARSEPPINTKIMDIVYEEYMSEHLSAAEIAEILNDRIEILYNEKK